MRKILFILALHGDEGYSIPVMERIVKLYPKRLYGYDWIIGNPLALEQGLRFVDKDLNRSAPGSISSPDYEERRAAELIELSRKYDAIIDVHGSTSECGVTTLVPLPTKANLRLARACHIQRNIIWQSQSSSIKGPVVQHTFCPAIEIECGSKNDPVVAEELYEVLVSVLQRNRQGKFCEDLTNPAASFFLVYGKDMGAHDLSVQDFKKVTLQNGETFFPYMANQYDNIKYYKMRRLSSSEVEREFAETI